MINSSKQVTWLVGTEVRSTSARLFAGTWRPTIYNVAISFIVECGIATFSALWMCSSPKLPLCQILFLLWPPNAELARQEKSSTQSLNHSPRLFDAPGTEARVLRNKVLNRAILNWRVTIISSITGWHGGTIGSTLDLRFTGCRFKSWPGIISYWPCASYLHLCASVTKHIIWYQPNTGYVLKVGR